MDDRISECNLELEKGSHAFIKQAEQLALWDRHILVNRHILLELEEELHKVFCYLNLTLSCQSLVACYALAIGSLYHV